MIEEKPDITLMELKELLNKKCCLDAVHNMVKPLGLTLKKTLKSSEQDRPDVIQKREEWLDFQKNTPRKRPVFIDESAAKTNMIRLYSLLCGNNVALTRQRINGRRLRCYPPFVQMGIRNPLFLKEL